MKEHVMNTDLEINESLINDAKALEKAEISARAILRAGKMLMSSGAEVYRVEETMTRLGYSIADIDYCAAYVMVTGIICSVEVGGQTVTRMARIRSQSRNLGIVNAINALSRAAEKKHYSPEQLLKKLQLIQKLPDYTDGQKALWGAIGAAGFAIFFGGGQAEMVLVFVAGLAVRYVSILCAKVNVNEFFINMLLSFVTAVLCVFFHRVVPETQTSIMIISVLMLLVPGLMITNALRDSVMGEPLSAVVLLMQALLIAAAIAAGVLVGLYVMGA